MTDPPHLALTPPPFSRLADQSHFILLLTVTYVMLVAVARYPFEILQPDPTV